MPIPIPNSCTRAFVIALPSPGDEPGTRNPHPPARDTPVPGLMPRETPLPWPATLSGRPDNPVNRRGIPSPVAPPPSTSPPQAAQLPARRPAPRGGTRFLPEALVVGAREVATTPTHVSVRLPNCLSRESRPEAPGASPVDAPMKRARTASRPGAAIVCAVREGGVRSPIASSALATRIQEERALREAIPPVERRA